MDQPKEKPDKGKHKQITGERSPLQSQGEQARSRSETTMQTVQRWASRFPQGVRRRSYFS